MSIDVRRLRDRWPAARSRSTAELRRFAQSPDGPGKGAQGLYAAAKRQVSAAFLSGDIAPVAVPEAIRVAGLAAAAALQRLRRRSV